MNRRKFITGLPLLAAGALVAYAAARWIHLYRTPDLDYLHASRNTLISIVDVLIPETDSPSASQCGVHDYIIKTIDECTDTTTQNKFIDGLRSLEKYCHSSFGNTFAACTAAEKHAVLLHISETDKPWNGFPGKVERKYLGSAFFVTLRQYCVRGYFTSEGGATKALRYSHVPSRYVACEPCGPEEKAWATS